MKNLITPKLLPTTLLAILLPGLCPTISFGWQTSDNGLYQNSSTQARVAPNASSRIVPSSSEVFDTTIRVLNSFRRGGVSLTLNPIVSANGGVINVTGDAGALGPISGTVTVQSQAPSISGQSATVNWSITATGRVSDLLIDETIRVRENFTLRPGGLILYSSTGLSGSFAQDFTRSQTTLSRVSLGTGSETNPFIPPNPNWTQVIIVVIIPVLPNQPTRFDPPFAKGFDYTIKEGRSERISKVYAPKGFGSKIKVYASSKAKGKLQFVGTVASGKSIDLTKNKAFKSGAAYVRMEGMNPKPDLAKRAPYAVGFTFTKLREATAVVEVRPRKG